MYPKDAVVHVKLICGFIACFEGAFTKFPENVTPWGPLSNKQRSFFMSSRPLSVIETFLCGAVAGCVAVSAFTITTNSHKIVSTRSPFPILLRSPKHDCNCKGNW